MSIANLDVFPPVTLIPIDLPIISLVPVHHFSPSGSVHIVASMSRVWKTLPAQPRYFRFYSRSNESDFCANAISSVVYIMSMPKV